MSQVGQLGPLDPQVSSKRREKFFEGERQSPLEAFEAIREAREFSLTSLDAVMSLLLERGVAPRQALETAKSFAISIVEPISGKIDPYDWGAFALDSKVAVEYCQRVGQPAGGTRKTQKNVDPAKLVELYPAHEFVIDIEEAQALGFTVEAPDPQLDELFDQIAPALGEAHKCIALLP